MFSILYRLITSTVYVLAEAFVLAEFLKFLEKANSHRLYIFLKHFSSANYSTNTKDLRDDADIGYRGYNYLKLKWSKARSYANE